MSDKQLYLDKITREEIKEAMQRFFEKGGEINKIEGIPNPLLDDDSSDTSDSFLHEDPSFCQVSTSTSIDS
ncbi:hypothetical protein WDW89_08805 [Deltaproteobacteria bacterium TL4]